MNKVKLDNAKKAKLVCHSYSAFRAKEKILMREGFRWAPNIHTRLLEDDTLYASPYKYPRGLLVRYSVGAKHIYPFFQDDKAAFRRVEAEAEKFPSASKAAAYLLSRPVPTRSKKRIEEVTIGVDPASPDGDHAAVVVVRKTGDQVEIIGEGQFTNKQLAHYKKVHIDMIKKPYSLVARAIPESIDFYEIASALTRNNPVAVIKSGVNAGHILIHKQIFRVAHQKDVTYKDEFGNDWPLQAPSSVASGGGYKLDYGNAFRVDFNHPSEITDWLKWIKAVRNAPWGEEKRTYEVTFPEV